MEITGPRPHITPVDGLPLVRLTQPKFTGAHRVLKNAFDRLGVAVALENWSVTLDLTILWETVNAVRLGRGAY
jgi:lipopolysaccharide/colanic/teichoic acid biosynthesis glycosyltransferase